MKLKLKWTFADNESFPLLVFHFERVIRSSQIGIQSTLWRQQHHQFSIYQEQCDSKCRVNFKFSFYEFFVSNVFSMHRFVLFCIENIRMVIHSEILSSILPFWTTKKDLEPFSERKRMNCRSEPNSWLILLDIFTSKVKWYCGCKKNFVQFIATLNLRMKSIIFFWIWCEFKWTAYILPFLLFEIWNWAFIFCVTHHIISVIKEGGI